MRSFLNLHHFFFDRKSLSCECKWLSPYSFIIENYLKSKIFKLNSIIHDTLRVSHFTFISNVHNIIVLYFTFKGKIHFVLFCIEPKYLLTIKVFNCIVLSWHWFMHSCPHSHTPTKSRGETCQKPPVSSTALIII